MEFLAHRDERVQRVDRDREASQDQQDLQVPPEIAENQAHQDVRVRGVRWVLAVNVERQGRGVREGRTAVTVDQETVAAAEDHQEPPAQQAILDLMLQDHGYQVLLDSQE